MANPNEELERGVKKLQDQGHIVNIYGRADSTKRYKYHYEVDGRFKASKEEIERLGAGDYSCEDLLKRWKKRQAIKT